MLSPAALPLRNVPSNRQYETLTDAQSEWYAQLLRDAIDA